MSRRLIFIVALCIVPAMLVGVLLISYDYFKRERARVERDALATSRALVAAVDAELIGARSALLALATSPNLASGDLRAFHAQATLAIKDQAFTNVVIREPGGRQLLNTLKPYGAPLPAQGDPGGLLRVISTGAPVISDLFISRLTGRYIIGVSVPVYVDGRARYALSAGISPDRLSTLMQSQRLPESWVAGILDSAGTVVGRTHDPQRFVGKPGSTDLVSRTKEASEGAFDSETLEGIPVLTVFSRSPLSGWAVALGIPQREMTLLLLDSLARLFVVAFIVLALSLAIGLTIARRTMRSLVTASVAP